MSLLDGLIGHWEFNEGGGSTTADLSANAADGTVVGGPIWTKIGPAGGLVLNGTSQYVSIPDTALLDPNTYTACLTIAAWCKTSSAASNMIFGGYKGTSPFSGYGFAIGATVSGKMQYWSSLGSWIAANTLVNDGNLHLCAVSVNRASVVGGAQVLFYLDGAPDGVVLGQPPADWRGVRAIGATAGGGSNRFNGIIGAVTLWCRSLTGSEHAKYYNNGFGQTHPFNIRRMGRPLGSRIIVP